MQCGASAMKAGRGQRKMRSAWLETASEGYDCLRRENRKVPPWSSIPGPIKVTWLAMVATGGPCLALSRVRRWV